jgi:hypothetical protein
MTRPKHAGGRPKLYRHEMCDQFVDAMAKGKIDISALEPEQRDQLREILLAAKALGTKTV